ncbi:RNA recognition motif domain-containing protein [Psychromonas hadalis]|uniref:RNA recognition motif domain-containing protein n=1 Tax=Psychromonas hadalis TaxID=211669 RepID=UPI0003B70287|nr:RNA-binding protein [Psychromonas hadalis]
MKLLVRNLATATSEEKLVSLFSEHGKVQSCSLVLDQKTGKSKGFGFIEMPKAGDAKAAMKKLNGFKLAGNIIRVKKAESKTESKVTDNVLVDKKVDEEKSESVQFKQKPTPVAVAKESTDESQIDNTGNAANIYGKVKESDDY